MADSSGTTDSVLPSTGSVRNHASIAFPWPLIAACILVIFGIVTCVILVFIHLAAQDQTLFRIDQNLCKVAAHDAKVDRTLASRSHINVKIEIPIDCAEVSD